MSDVRVVREVSSVSRGTSDGDLMALRGTRDGAVFTADWFLAAALEGRAFGVNAGTGTSPITTNAGALIVAEPDLLIQVPAGTTIIPVYIEYAFEDTGAAGPLEVIAMASSAATQAASGTAGTALTIYNMRTDAPNSTNCTADRTNTGGVTPYTGNFIEFFRGYAGDATDQHGSNTAQTVDTATRFSWSASQTMVPPILTGISQLCVYQVATAGVGFCTVIWVEFPSNSIV